jgi:1,2-diacylglycerol 3-alpha-glucosyltransferase
MHQSSSNRTSAVGPPPSEADDLARLGGTKSEPRPNRRRRRILVVWGNWGPYHHARFRALHEHGQQNEIEVHGLELFPTSGIYDWEVSGSHPAIHHLSVGQNETEFNPLRLAWNLIPLLVHLRCDVVFVPSYWHWSLFTNVMARLCGGRIVMMNESHAGTELATGWRKWIKRRIVRSFHAALVGGTPHIEHFTGLGLPSSVVFSGYDAVDNDFFAERSEESRQNAGTTRTHLGLPDDYFLSLGRMVPKKNLTTLILSYILYRQNEPESRQHLVFVGSGEEERKLRELATRNNLEIIDHTEPTAPGEIPSPAPTVHFYGFRQIEENPSFYALATAFILPSLKEEWGLVVNEAMACGLPVLVSNRAGCAANLVRPGYNGYTFNPESVDELAAALCRVANTTTRDQMGEHSREIVRHWGCKKFATGALQAAAVAAPHLSVPTPVLIP